MAESLVVPGGMLEANDAVVTADGRGRIVFWNNRAEEIFGYTEEELLGKPLTMLMPERYRKAHEEGLRRVSETGFSRLDGKPLHLHGLRNDGNEFPLELLIRTWRSDKEIFFSGVMRDSSIAIGRGLSQPDDVIFKISQIFSGTSQPDVALKRAVELIASGLEATAAILWLVSHDRHTIHSAQAWSSKNSLSELAGLNGKYPIGVGVPGQVWADKVPLSIEDLSADAKIMRQQASEAGFTSLLAFPVFHGDSVLGVLEVLSPSPMHMDAGRVTLLAHIGGQIGQFISGMEAEEQARQSTAFAENLIETASALVVIVDERGGIERVNRTAEELAGVPRAALSGRLWIELVDDFGGSWQKWFSFRPGRRESSQFESGFLRPNGESRVILWSASELLEYGAAKTILFGVDITDRRIAENSLRIFEDTIAAMPLGVMIWKRERVGQEEQFVLKAANPAAQRNSNAELVVGSRLESVLEEGFEVSTKAAFADVLQSGEVRQARESRRPEYEDGEGRVLETTIFPLSSDTVGVMNEDVTDQRIAAMEQQRLRAQLDLAERLAGLGRLAASVAHEFNNVLMGIQPFTEVLQRRHAADERTQQITGQMFKSIQRGKRISQDILTYTRPSEPQLRTVRAGEWLSEFIQFVAPQIPSNMMLRTECDPSILMNVDPGQLHQTLGNLLNNARDAMPSGGHVTVRIRPVEPVVIVPVAVLSSPDDFAHIEFSDDGVGMSQEVSSRIFEPLFTTKKLTGTGLGLAIVHRIVKQHGGEIAVESIEGAGTTFHIFLPRAKRAASIKDDGTATMRVAIVGSEDLLNDFRNVEAGQPEFNFRVITPSDDSSVMAAIQSEVPDAVILDIDSPGMDGFDLYRRLRFKLPEIPVIFCCAEKDDQRFELRESRRVAVLAKPFGQKELMEMVEQLSRK